MTELEMIKGLIEVVKKHERERPEFRATGYTDMEWHVITEAIIHVSNQGRDAQ